MADRGHRPQLRRLYGVEAAALATATVLLRRPDPGMLAAARVQVTPGAHSITTASGTTHTGVLLLDPTLPLLPPVAWHERHDPGAQELAELTKSPWLCRQQPERPAPALTFNRCHY